MHKFRVLSSYSVPISASVESESRTSMATAHFLEVDVSVFDCPICLERYKVPKVLPCLHTFCRQCIHAYVESFAKPESAEDENSAHYIECPVCRQRVVAPRPNISSEDWANTFPGNHLLLSLQEMNDGQETPKNSVLCEPCKRVNERKIALFYCSNCDEKLCKSCYSYMHSRITQYLNHSVTGIIATHSILPSSNDVDHCIIHKNKSVRFFCFDHEELSCSVCYDAIHHKCTNVKPLDEITENNNEEQLEHISCVIASLKRKLNSEIKKTITNVQQIEELQETIKNDVVTFVNDAKIRLDELQDKFLKNLEVMHAFEKSCLQNKQITLENFVQNLAHSELTLTKANANRPSRMKFLTKQRVKIDLTRHFDDFIKQENSYNWTTYEWNENDMLKSIKEMENIGNVRVIHDDSDFVSDLKREIELIKTPTPMNLQNLTNKASVVVNYVTSYFVRCQEDETVPWITDGEFLKDGSLMMVDKKNSSIKRISSTTGTTSVLLSKKSEEIRGLCTTDGDEKVFVSVGDTISEFSLSPTFRYEKDFSKEKMEFYQLVARQHNIFAHIGNPWCVRVIRKSDGKILKTLTGSSCGYGYFALSRDGNRIIYSKPGSVVCDEVESGNQVFQCSLKELGTVRKSIKGIGVDFHDNIYVCDSIGSSIIQISNDGKFVRKVIPKLHQIKKPYAICFDKSGKKFFVSSWLDTHCKIELYELHF